MQQSASGQQGFGAEGQQPAARSGVSGLAPEAMTAALQASGVLGCDNRVAHARLAPLGTDKSMMSSLYRVFLDYEHPCGAPSTVIAKVACEEPLRRSVADRFAFYEREVFFYERLAESVPFKVPLCYFASLNPGMDGPVLLLEDLGDAAVSQVDGCSWEQAVLVAGELARFHARWWGHVDGFAADIHSLDSVDYLNNIRKTFTDAWPSFVGRAGDRVPERLRALGDRWATDVVGELASIMAAPATLCHGDLRLDNLRFDEGQVIVFDFQLLARGNGVSDLAYFMSQSVPKDVRAGRDAEILDHYLRALAEEGVRFDAQSAMRVYRATVLYTLVFPVVLYHAFDELTDDSRSLVSAMLDRSVTAITELAAWDLVPLR
jgi:hypothetical protein